MTRIVTSAALAASLLLACGSSSNATTTGTVSGTGTTGTGTGTTTSSGTTSGSHTGTTSGATTNSSSSSTSGTIYCNGSELQSGSSMTDLYVATYPESDDIRNGCDTTFDTISDAGTVFSALGGILDTNSYSSQSGLLTIYPSGCEDLGMGTAPVITATTITPPSGASTVAAARTAQLDGGTVYGIVTYINSPYWDAKDMDADSATLWLQDQPTGSTPAPLSGISIFIDKKLISATGTAGYPDSGLARGDVVAISALLWSPYGTADSQDQLSYTGNSVVTVLGTQPLPAAVSLSATDIAGSMGQQYLGMRITQSDAPDTVINACPTLLQSN